MRHSVLTLVAFLAAMPVAAQQPKPAASPSRPSSGKAWSPPRTPDGHPDLQGIWLNNRATPLERPKALAGKAFLTNDEVAELKERAAHIFDGSGASDFAGGDAFFLALLDNPEHYKNGNTTGGSDSMIDRVFDNRTSLVVDPPDGRIPALTPEGRERLARAPTPTGAGPRLPEGPEDFSNALRCLSYGVPRIGTNNISGAGPLGYYQIVQTPGYVVLSLEAIHEARVVSMNGPHLPEDVREYSGDSRGRWEGDTLVVDTRNFSPGSNFMGSAANLHLVERFTRAGPDTLDYEITVDDPSTWTKPWTAVVHLGRTDEKILEYACHEGNYDLMHSYLAGARAKETPTGGSAKRQE
jgi:hypothetical protein